MKRALFTRLAFWSPLALSLALCAVPRADAAPRYKHVARPAQPAARSAAEVEATVRTLLSGYEPLDVEHGLAQLGPQAADVLLRLIKDRGTPVLLQLRAIEALGYVPTPAGQTYLRDLVAQIGTVEDERVFTLAAALRALSAFGVGELPSIALFLNHRSADVRDAAAAGMAQMRSADVLPALQGRLAIERDSGVQSTINAAIRRVAALPRR